MGLPRVRVSSNELSTDSVLSMLEWLFVDLPTWFFGLLSPAQWDAWRNWLATLGGLVALLIATNTYRRNVKHKREEQARLVYSRFIGVAHHEVGQRFDLEPGGITLGVIGPGVQVFRNTSEGTYGVALEPTIQTTVMVHNGSKELIGPVRVQMVNGGNGKTWEEFSGLLGSIEPEADQKINFWWTNTLHPAQPSLATTVIFRDSSGQWWRRHRAEPIERVHDDPENDGPTATERVNIRRQQIAQGYEPIEERKVPLKARWHRFWRERRGQSPTP